MVIAIHIDVRAQKAINLLNNVSVKLPNEIGEAGYDIAKDFERNLRQEVVNQGLIWRMNLWQGIQARRLSKYRSTVFMPQSGIYLDSMKPHYVKLKRGRLIRQWAMEKGNEAVQKIAMREGSIFVRPHPFIDQSFARTIPNIHTIVQRRADKAMMES